MSFSSSVIVGSAGVIGLASQWKSKVPWARGASRVLLFVLVFGLFVMAMGQLGQGAALQAFGKNLTWRAFLVVVPVFPALLLGRALWALGERSSWQKKKPAASIETNDASDAAPAKPVLSRRAVLQASAVAVPTAAGVFGVAGQIEAWRIAAPRGITLSGPWAAGGLRVHFWDFLFYALFGLIVTSFVQVGGVLMVFSYLIVPAACATFLVNSLLVRLLVGWCVATLASVAAARISAHFDLLGPQAARVVRVDHAPDQARLGHQAFRCAFLWLFFGHVVHGDSGCPQGAGLTFTWDPSVNPQACMSSRGMATCLSARPLMNSTRSTAGPLGQMTRRFWMPCR